jgi:hypothetical protein
LDIISNKTLTQQEGDMEYNNRQYVIFNTSELDTIDFDQVLETSADTVRKSIDNTKTFVKWNGDVPVCVETLETKGEYLTHDEILEILSSSEWTEDEVVE